MFKINSKYTRTDNHIFRYVCLSKLIRIYASFDEGHYVGEKYPEPQVGREKQAKEN